MRHLQVVSNSGQVPIRATTVNSAIADRLLIANPEKKITTVLSSVFSFWTQESGEGKGFTGHIGAGDGHISEGEQSAAISEDQGHSWS